ncbi:MAG: HIT domain-containing protein [Methanoregula sp.]|nr:HIT domain-containing protein [Methanoregula sp.]
MEPVKCPFCNPPDEDIVARNDLCYARWDHYPVSRGHLLVIPLRGILRNLKVQTIYSARGLRYRVVIVMGADESRAPCRFRPRA